MNITIQGVSTGRGLRLKTYSQRKTQQNKYVREMKLKLLLQNLHRRISKYLDC